MPTDLDLSDGEHKLHQARLGSPSDHRVQLSHPIPKDNGGPSTLCNFHVGEGVLQGAHALDRMDFEGGGEANLSPR